MAFDLFERKEGRKKKPEKEKCRFLIVCLMDINRNSIL